MTTTVRSGARSITRLLAGLIAAALVAAACGGVEVHRDRPSRSPRPRHSQSPSSGPSPSPSATPSGAGGSAFSCTLVLGFSQTSQWYKEGFEAQVDDASWELFFHNGAGISSWANPDSGMWKRAELYSPCAERSADPDRVLLTVSDAVYLSDASAWVALIEEAIATIRLKYPGAGEIILQPVVGGPDGERCDHNGEAVRATVNQPFIERAIQKVADQDGNVEPGAVPEVRTCDDYRDSIGHLTPEAKAPIAAEIGAYYRGA